MRLLIVNPNTCEGVTDRIDTAAQAIACDGDVFKTVSSAFGPELIVTDQDGLDAVDGVMASVDAHIQGMDGIVLASFGDTGADAVRSAYPQIPVVGIASGAFAAARCLGGKYSIVTFDESLSPALRESAIMHGMGERLHRIEAVEHTGEFNPAEVQIDRFEAISALCELCAQDAITSIVLGGGPLAGLASRISTSAKILMIDGTQAAIGVLRSVIRG
jgi:Asp/Glu/hydantoin racemase